MKLRTRLAKMLDLVEYVNSRFYARYVEAFSCWLDPDNAIMHFTLKQAIQNIKTELPYKVG